jgi:hypothetical protein
MAGKGLKGAVFGCLAGKGVSDERNERVWAAILTEDEEQMNAQQERTALAVASPAPNWLSAQAIAFAVAHPEDPRGRIVSGGARDAAWVRQRHERKILEGRFEVAAAEIPEERMDEEDAVLV